MKNLKTLLLLALGTVTIPVHADFLFNDPLPVIIAQGQTFSSAIEILPDVSGTVTSEFLDVKPFLQSGPNWKDPAGGPSINGVANPFSSWSYAFSPSSSVTFGTVFDETVTYTAADDAVPGIYGFISTLDVFHDIGRTKPHFVTTPEEVGFILVEIIPAPEPSQIVEGTMLLGGVGLIFIGRRLLRRNSCKA